MIVAVISEEKANQLADTQHLPDTNYNPVYTPDGKWIISLVELQYLQVSDVIELIDYIQENTEE